MPERRSMFAAAVLLAACTGAVAPPPARAGLTITLRASPHVVAVGDTVYFTAIAHNATGERIQVGQQCGPSLDVQISAPSGGAVRSVLAEFVGPNGAFTCELGPYHFAEPNDSLVTRLKWKVPAAAAHAVHVAVAGARRSEGLEELSAPVQITVR